MKLNLSGQVQQKMAVREGENKEMIQKNSQFSKPSSTVLFSSVPTIRRDPGPCVRSSRTL